MYMYTCIHMCIPVCIYIYRERERQTTQTHIDILVAFILMLNMFVAIIMRKVDASRSH